MKRAFGLSWAVAVLGIMFAELNGPVHSSSFMKLADAVTEDGPAAAAGFLAGALIMHVSMLAEEQGRQVAARANLIAWGAACLVIGLLIYSIQIAIIPVIMTVGLVVVMLTPLARASTGVLTALYLVCLGISAAIHPIFHFEVPIGGPYPIIAWLAYGITGLVVYRVIVNNPKRVGMVFFIACIIGFATFFAALLDYFNFLGGSAGTSSYYQSNPGATSIPFFSSAAHSGGLLNVIGNSTVGTYLFTACLFLQRFPAFRPLENLGYLAFITYPIYVLLMAAYMGGFPGFGDELSRALSTQVSTSQATPLDWHTFASWVHSSSSWDELGEFEKQYFGPFSSNFSSLFSSGGVVNHNPVAFPIVALISLVVANAWVHFFRFDFFDRLFRHN